MSDAASCELSEMECKPCKGGIPPLAGEELASFVERLGTPWHVVDGHHLEATFTFPDFKNALVFVNQLGALAEQVGHHPDLHLSWGTVRVEVWTHKIDGLAEADFIFAAKATKLISSSAT